MALPARRRQRSTRAVQDGRYREFLTLAVVEQQFTAQHDRSSNGIAHA
jgi:hypothetical protein